MSTFVPGEFENPRHLKVMSDSALCAMIDANNYYTLTMTPCGGLDNLAVHTHNKFYFDTECDRTYSSVWDNNACGTGHAQSSLESPEAWSAGSNAAGESMTIDMGSSQTVHGVRTKTRADSPWSSQCVTQYTVEVAGDDQSFSSVDGGAVFAGPEASDDAEAEIDALFAALVTARYVKLVVVATSRTLPSEQESSWGRKCSSR